MTLMAFLEPCRMRTGKAQMGRDRLRQNPSYHLSRLVDGSPAPVVSEGTRGWCGEDLDASGRGILRGPVDSCLPVDINHLG